MLPPPWEPSRSVLSKDALHDCAEQQRRKCVACIRTERKFCAAHAVFAGRLSEGQRVVPRADEFISNLESVAPEDLGEILLECEVFADRTGAAVRSKIVDA